MRHDCRVYCKCLSTGHPDIGSAYRSGKAKIKAAGIPYEVPDEASRPARLGSVLRVVYLVFSEGQASHNAALLDESIRLARLLQDLMPEPEVTGLLALLVLHDARRQAYHTTGAEPVPLEEQDRASWNHDMIVEGCELAQQALSRKGFGAYALQAAIAALHGEVKCVASSDWLQIIGLYDALIGIEPSPVVALNRVVAVGMRDGPQSALALIEPLLTQIPDYYAVAAAAAAAADKLVLREPACALQATENQICTAVPEHHRRCIRVSGVDIRHGGQVADAQALDATHAQA